MPKAKHVMVSKAGEIIINAGYSPPRARCAEYITTFLHDEPRRLVGHPQGNKSGRGSPGGQKERRKSAGVGFE